MVNRVLLIVAITLLAANLASNEPVSSTVKPCLEYQWPTEGGSISVNVSEIKMATKIYLSRHREMPIIIECEK